MISNCDIFHRIRVWSHSNEWLDVPLSSVRIYRPNFPFNCFTLDLSQNSDIKEKGLKQIFFYFHSLAGTFMEMLIEDKSLACTREIKENKFYSSGPNIELKDLGNSTFTEPLINELQFRQT